MKTNAIFPALILAVAVSAASAVAQDKTAPAAPASPAPVAINGYVYADKLPTPTQLVKDAEAEGLTVVRMDQSPDKIIAIYQYPDGRTRAFAYLPASAQDAAPVYQAAPPAMANARYTVVNTPTPAPTVVYAEPERVYYSTRYYRSYDPAWDFWAPLTLGIGLGWATGGHGSWHGGGYGGHFHGHR